MDLGGTAVKVVVADAGGALLHRARDRLRGTSAPDVAGQIAAAVAAAEGAGAGTTPHVGVAVPGVLDPETGVLLQSANLGWKGVPVRDLLEGALGRPVVLEKDGAAAALGEHWLGAGRGAAALLLVSVGTGIGGGVILSGRLWRGRSGVAGGLGHVVIAPGGPSCRCGARGCLEALLLARAPEAGSPGAALAHLAREAPRDARAAAGLEAALADLAAALAPAISALNPDRLVLAGGVLADVPSLAERIAGAVRARLPPHAAEGLGIVPGALEGYGGAVGAARLALEAGE
ncbi:MAG: ROK family protein [Planctomycetales bacterium]|nr:ROK family protein [Planctomycetales bacterium]